MKIRKAIILWIARALRVNVNSLVIIPFDDSIKWISMKAQYPEGDDKIYLIRHYNSHVEVARFVEGNWFVVSNNLRQDDEQIDSEFWPDYWAVITEPEEL